MGSEIRDRLQEMGAPADAMAGGDSGETNLDLSALPGPIRSVVQDSYADSFGHIFLIAAVVAVFTLVAVLVVRGAPLRTTVAMQPSGASATSSEQTVAAHPDSTGSTGVAGGGPAAPRARRGSVG